MKKILLIILLVLAYQSMKAQLDTVACDKLNVYLDCAGCDIPYFRQNFTLIKFITEPATADVHIVQSFILLGNGNRAVSMVFVGRKKFIMLNDTLNFIIPADYTYDEERVLQLEKLKLGLVPFLLKTDQSENLSLVVKQNGSASHDLKDPWNSWNFTVSFNGFATYQKFHNSLNLSSNIYASKITEDFKAECNSGLNYNETTMIFDEGNDEDFILNKSYFSRNLFVKSIGQHFGTGGALFLMNDMPGNLDFQFCMGPAFEYSIYPYAEALHKQFRFIYSIYFEYNNYVDSTIFFKLKDENVRQQLFLLAKFQDTWGYFNVSLAGSSYLSDYNKFSLSASLSTDIRLDKLSKGLSLNLNMGMAMLRDVISQPISVPDKEEVLKNQKRMATDYQYNWSIGISYRFGSKKYPALNPRFDF